jgi:hypothetical protein
MELMNALEHYLSDLITGGLTDLRQPLIPF